MAQFSLAVTHPHRALRGARPPVWPLWDCAHLCPMASPGLALSQLSLTLWGQRKHSACFLARLVRGMAPGSAHPLCMALLSPRPGTSLGSPGSFLVSKEDRSCPSAAQAQACFQKPSPPWSWARVGRGSETTCRATCVTLVHWDGSVCARGPSVIIHRTPFPFQKCPGLGIKLYGPPPTQNLTHLFPLLPSNLEHLYLIAAWKS